MIYVGKSEREGSRYDVGGRHRGGISRWLVTHDGSTGCF